MVALEEDYFLVKFHSVTDYEFAKFGGPWMVLEHYLIVQEWRPNFDPRTDKTERVLVWVRFPDLPVEYFDYNFLMRIGSLIGEPKNIDEATSLVSRGRFARMCIEVDITKPLLSKYKLRRRVRTIEYEGIHLVCFKCGIYGHKEEQCGKPTEGATGMFDGEVAGEQTEKSAGSEKGTETNTNGNLNMWHNPLNLRPEVMEQYGAWMLAPRRGGNQKGRGYNFGVNRQIRGSNEGLEAENEGIEVSKFAVLASEGEGDNLTHHIS